MALERTWSQVEPKDADFPGFSLAWARVGFFGLPDLADTPAVAKRINPENAPAAPENAAVVSRRADRPERDSAENYVLDRICKTC